tara:strand:- start:1706 stop:2707 length:1002 start_codon:yes stop_codon:yes gene_type:complete
MAVTYTGAEIPTDFKAEIIAEILFRNETVEKNLVAFETGIKAGRIITENINSVTMQAWTVNPTGSEAGAIGLEDTVVTPVKVEFIDKFTPDDLRSTRFNRDMAAGAINDISDEFNRLVLNGVAPLISLDAENKYWNGATAATQTAVAALSSGTGQTAVGAAEKTLVAAMPTTLFDSLTARIIYNKAAVGGRIKVAGTTLSATNIATEMGKVYNAIPDEVLAGAEKPLIYAPRGVKKFINNFNIAQTYRDTFSVDLATGKYFYLDVEIVFIPLAPNVLIAGVPMNFMWCTDLLDDYSNIEIQKYPAPRKDYFYDVIFTIFAHVVNQKFNVLYVG